MKFQTALATGLLATLGALPSLSFAQDSNELQSHTFSDATAEAADELTDDADQLSTDNFGPRRRGPGRPGIGPRPGPGYGPRPPVIVAPAPRPGYGPRPLPPIYRPSPYPGTFPRPGHVYNPYPVYGGTYPWPRWNRPVIVHRPYPFAWNNLRTVTCTAQNASGYQFPVTQTGYAGIGYQNQIYRLEQAAIDRCYAETNGDASCQLLGCTPGY